MIASQFKWQTISTRQRKLLTWWCAGSPFSKYNGIICDGAIRSGKTVCMGFSFVMWAMQRFNGNNFAICGKTVGSCRRNVIVTLKRQLAARGFDVVDHHADNVLMVSKGTTTNAFYLFGGKDEASQDLIQGITLAGVMFDEVALMPQSFVNQATARCSVTGSKFWFNCNPAGPQHWFYKEWILKCNNRRMVYLHFTMADNLTLSPDVVERYASQYAGVFYSRFIDGLWVMADGLIYDMFDKQAHVIEEMPQCYGDYFVSSDYGIQNATVFLLWQRCGPDQWACLKEYYYSGRDEKRQKTTGELADDLIEWLDGIMPKQVIIDPSAAALIAEIKRKGLHVAKADNDVLDGIADVSSLLRQEKLLFYGPKCANTIKEFGMYAWDSKAADSGIDRPIKVNDHAMDAVRYFVRTKRLVKKANTQHVDSNFL